MNVTTSPNVSPELPLIAKIPVTWVPMPLKAIAITSAVNVLFARPLQDKELEFLRQHVINIFVSDAGLRFSLRLEKDRLYAAGEVPKADLTIEGTVYTFLLLATRKEDADTLFFRRQLKTTGDTELGLFVKNFLDGLDPETIPWHGMLDPILQGSISVADRLEDIRSRLSK